nr:MAG TPA: hypothetical protein [Caudoviricetes sp.]
MRVFIICYCLLPQSFQAHELLAFQHMQEVSSCRFPNRL